MRMRQQIEVPFAYPVIFTRGAFDPANASLAAAANPPAARRRCRLVVVVDGNLARARPRLMDGIRRYCRAHRARLELAAPPRRVPGGERLKNDFTRVMGLARWLLDLRLCRHSVVVAVGGGAVLDAVGFAVALAHRGLRLVRVPSTTLAQCDSGVGVKTAVNFGGKNLLGTFTPPFAVLNDAGLLATLPEREWIGGVAEAFKVAVIRDARFFRWLCRHAARLRAREAAPMEQAIRRCALLHLRHIRASGDPFEFGRARPLDFGHWSAHKLEALAGFRLGHGQAVAIGIALDALYAAAQGWMKEPEAMALCAALRRAGFRLWHPALDLRDRRGRRRLWEGLDEFREHLGGELCLTMPRGIGRKFETDRVDLAAMERCLRRLAKLDLPGFV